MLAFFDSMEVKITSICAMTLLFIIAIIASYDGQTPEQICAGRYPAAEMAVCFKGLKDSGYFNQVKR